MMEQKYFKGGETNISFVGQKYTKYNKINNPEKFRGSKNAAGGASPSIPLSFGPTLEKILAITEFTRFTDLRSGQYLEKF